jgi:ABC-type transporter Mla subunit MlaD
MFAAISFFFSAAGIAIIFCIKAAHTETAKVNAVLDNANATLTELNRPKFGVIAQVYAVTLNARLALDNANKAAIDERLFLEKQQPLEMDKLNAILDQTNRVLVSVNTTVSGIGVHTDTTLDSLNQTIVQTRPVFVQFATTLQSTNKVISDPNIPATINNLKQTTASLNQTVQDSDAIVKDTQQWWHSFLHPSWGKRIWNAVTNTGETVAKFFF